MAQYTSHYHFKKPVYGERIDVSDLNGNMDIAEAALDGIQEMVAGVYDTSKTYHQGDFCIYEDILYRCIVGTTQTTTGDFDDTKWEIAQDGLGKYLGSNTRRTNEAWLGMYNFSALFDNTYPEDYDETSTTYSVGDLCRYNLAMYKCIATTSGVFDDTKWVEVKFDDVFERKHTWTLFETYTVDTAARTIRRNLPAGTNGIYVRITLAAASANAEFGVVVQTTARHGLGDIANYLQTSTGYGLCRYTREGGFWNGYLSNRTSSLQASAGHTERLDNFVLDDADAEYIEFRTNTSGAVVPAGSMFEIYVRK